MSSTPQAPQASQRACWSHTPTSRASSAPPTRGLHFGPHDTWTLFHSYAFDFSVWELWGALLYGGRLVIVPMLDRRARPRRSALLCDERVTILNQTPSAFRQLIAARPKSRRTPDRSRTPCAESIFGGEALELQTLEPWIERYRCHASRSSTCTASPRPPCMSPIAPSRAPTSDGRRGSLIGMPLPDLRIYLLDERGEPVPLGVAGETVRRRRGRRARLPEPARADRRALRRRPVRPARRAALPHRRPGALAARRRARVPRPQRLTRSRSAASASSWARSRRGWPRCPACARLS